MNLNIDQLRLAAKQKIAKSARVRKRLIALIELSKRMKLRRLRQLDYDIVATEFEITSRTLMRWKKRWEKQGFKGLIPKRPPGRRRKPISGFTAKRIMEFRKKYRWGAEVIRAHLRLDYGIMVSENRINRYLKRKTID